MRRASILLSAALFFELLALCGIAALGDLRAHLPAFLALFVVACTAALLAWIALRAVSLSLLQIVLVAIVLRAPLLLTQPTLSDDVWRYLHDGRAQVAGISPFAYAPVDARTVAFRGPEYARINHPYLPTIYPPAAQLAFRINAMLGSSVLIWRIGLIAAELLMLMCLAGLIRRRHGDLCNLVLYAWHPLAVVEVVGSGHVEPIAISLMIGGLYMAALSKTARAGVLLGFSIACKFVAAPVMLASSLLGKPRLLIAAVLTTVGLYVGYWDNGTAFGSLSTFAANWEANGSIYVLLAALTDGHRARIIAATILLCAIVLIRHARQAPEDSAALVMLALLLLSPVVHPWYLLWLLCLMPLVGGQLRWLRDVGLLWSVVVVGVYAGAGAAWLEYGLIYGLLVVSVLRGRWLSSRSGIADRVPGIAARTPA